jgi:cytidylate kinase
MLLTDNHVSLLITGISASGKSTVADLLSRRFDRGVHVKGDVFRRMVVAGREEMTEQPTAEALRQLRLRYSLGAMTTDAYFAQGFSVVVQDVVIGQMLREYVEMIRSRPLCVVVLTPDTAVVAAREAARNKTAYRVGFDDIDTLDHALRRETPLIGLWLDTSEQTPEETVSEIADRAWNEARIA